MDLRAGTKVTDRVALVEPLGEGAMGAVWKAEHSTLRTHVAVKFISEETTTGRADVAERFALEAAAAAQIKSPHVVQMIDHGLMKDGTPYIVMELLTGESLEERIEREHHISLEVTADILTQVAKALDAAHSIGVIHRDIKPHNIFLTDMHGETFVKVLDFGIAKQTRVASGKEITEPGMIVGTPQYVSRDLIMGRETKIDSQVDLWSLTVVAYKCLTGSLPFDGDSIGAICTALATSVFKPPSERTHTLPGRVDAWFRRAFAASREDRFATAAELAASFRALIDEEDGAPGGNGAADGSDEPRVWHRRYLRLGVAVGALLALALVASWLTTRPPSSDVAPSATSGALAQPGPRPTSSAPSQVTSAMSASAHAHASSVPASIGSTGSKPRGTVAGVDAVGEPREIAIPAGTVQMGCDEQRDSECAPDEKPRRVVQIDAFVIDRTEVTVIDYAECVMAAYCSDWRLRGYSIDGGPFMRSDTCNWQGHRRERHPINCVNYQQAKSYCEWRGARLPTEAEWERAARGDDGRLFPWGDEQASCAHAVMAEEGDVGCGKSGTWPVGKKLRDSSPFGVLELGGNVREWVSDWYDEEYYLTGRRENPPGPNRGERRVTRGGSWGNKEARFLRASDRDFHDPATRSLYVGFRCAR